MIPKIRLITSISTSGFFLCLDQFLKHIARTHQNTSLYLIKPWLGWEYFANNGIAFSLPVPTLVIIFFTPFVLWYLLHHLTKSPNQGKHATLALCLITAGAVSNFIDRMLFGATTDYLRILTAVINFADVMIVLGALLLIMQTKKPTAS